MDEKLIKKIVRTISIVSMIIAAISVYFLLKNDLEVKPLAGKGDGFNKEQLPIGGDFTLTDYNGEKFSSNQLKGKLSLIYFGFTFCPDICPTSLQKISQIIEITDKYNIDIIPVFITVDPNRDNPDSLKKYLKNFNSKFIGLTGTISEVKEVADLFKVYYAISESENNKEHYMIDHSSFLYLMDKNGKYLKHFYMSDTIEEIIDYIRLVR